MTPPATIAARHPTRTVRRGPSAPRPSRRTSGPPRPKRDPRANATAATAVARAPFAMRLGARAMRVGDARLLDRLVRGRAWIALMAIGLLGIVFMQVSLLKLNAGISRAVTAADTFDRQNSSLREDISKLDSGERIQAVAAKLGMVTPAAGDVHYLDGRGADAARAAAAIKPPHPVTPAVTPPATTTPAPAATTTAPVTSSAAPATANAVAATSNTAPATTNTAPATTNTAPATTNTAPATTNTAPATTNTAPATTNTAPPAAGWAGSNSAGGASAPQGQG